MTLTFYDGLGDTAYCNYSPPFNPDASAPTSSFLPLSDIKNRSIILVSPAAPMTINRLIPVNLRAHKRAAVRRLMHV